MRERLSVCRNFGRPWPHCGEECGSPEAGGSMRPKAIQTVTCRDQAAPTNWPGPWTSFPCADRTRDCQRLRRHRPQASPPMARPSSLATACPAQLHRGWPSSPSLFTQASVDEASLDAQWSPGHAAPPHGQPQPQTGHRQSPATPNRRQAMGRRRPARRVLKIRKFSSFESIVRFPGQHKPTPPH